MCWRSRGPVVTCTVRMRAVFCGGLGACLCTRCLSLSLAGRLWTRCLARVAASPGTLGKGTRVLRARCREHSTGGLARRSLSHRVDACMHPPALHAPSPEPGSRACVCPLVAWTCAPMFFVCLACPLLAKSASVCPALVPTVPPLRLRVLRVLVWAMLRCPRGCVDSSLSGAACIRAAAGG